MTYLVIAVLGVACFAFTNGKIATCSNGVCKSVYNCGPLLMIYNKGNKTREEMKLLRDLSCGRNKVCCSTSESPSRVIPSTSPRTHELCPQSAQLPGPESKCCGIHTALDEKIIGGTSTQIDEYPWLARLENEICPTWSGKCKRIMDCGGFLISGRYVLTAGHCIKSDRKPINVHLGEYDTTNSVNEPDRVIGDQTDGVTVIAIEKTILHPEYGHDIALLRLKTMAPYTDFIRPICLPTSDITLEARNHKFIVAGWGRIGKNKSPSKTKLAVQVPFVPLEECRESFNSSRYRELKSYQMCAGGEAGKDSCNGDSGGPLAYYDRGSYTAVGIVSFGPADCGTIGVPGVYTNVYQHMQWIRNEIKP